MLAVLACRAAAQSPAPCVVQGDVHDSATGAPLVRASVRMAPEGNGPGYLGTTDVSGQFCFRTVQAGDYEVAIECRGYLRDETTHLHVAEGQQVKDLHLIAIPYAVITGRVLDPDGEPVAGVAISVLHAEWRNGRRLWTHLHSEDANERGEFRVTELPPGRYLVAARAEQSNRGAIRVTGVRDAPGAQEWRLGAVYYPDAAPAGTGGGVELKAGQELSGLELKLPKVACFHVSGRVDLLSRQDSGMGPLGVGAIQLDDQGNPVTDWSWLSTVVQSGGRFDLAGVPAGRYLVFEIRTNTNSEMTSVKVTDHSVEGLAVHDAPAPLRVTSRDDTDMPPGKEFRLFLVPGGFDAVEQYGAEQAKGTLQFLLPSAGRYRLYLRAHSDVYVKSMSLAGQPASGPEIDLPRGGADLEVLLAGGTGEVSGTAELPAGVSTGKPGLTAVLMAVEEKPGQRAVLSDDAEQSGGFRFQYVPPGEYRLLLVEQFHHGLWENREFRKQVEGLGKTVVVSGKGTVSAQAPVVDAATVEAAIARLGR